MVSFLLMLGMFFPIIFTFLIFKKHYSSTMALSLRKRLGRRTAQVDLKHSTDEQVASSGDSASSQENLQPNTTDTKDEQGYKVIAKNDMSTTPPPSSRKLRSNTEKSARNVSPSQSLLDRYKNRSATAQVAITAKGTMSPARPAKAALKTGKDTAFSEDFEMSALEPSDTVNDDHDGFPSDMEVIEGVEFEMMGKKGRAGQPPVEDTVPLLPPRSTRSQAKRQQRADSLNARVEEKDSLIPPGLSIRKPGDRNLPRTPSPRIAQADEVVGE